MSDYKLLPCPWCKTTDKRKIISKNFTGEYRVEHFCEFASILGRKWFKTPEQAAEVWNTRTQLSHQKGASDYGMD